MLFYKSGRYPAAHVKSVETELIPANPGSYVLHLQLAEPAYLLVGRLGAFNFPAGDYFYFGSAQGPGGLRGRLKHHLAISTRPHWHIDWLRSNAVLSGGWYSMTPGRLECAWSQALMCLPGAALPARGFGSADCRSGCSAHLVAFPGGLDHAIIEAKLRFPGTRQIYIQAFRAVDISEQ